MKSYKITHVTAVRYPVLSIAFEDGLMGEIDFTDDIAKGPIFAPLKDPDYFKQVALDPGGRSFGWNLHDLGNEIDFCADSTRIDIETKIVEEHATRYRGRRSAAE